ncbi:ankyrin repeat-containing domain protein [Nemania sp. FL0916]|nr:ankyrin repeat-containing domain protein [Nemania sp. FL0916]
MEVAGLAIGVAGLAGLFSSCLDIVERWDAYKDFQVEHQALAACLAADRARFQQWGQSVGIDKAKPEIKHHQALDEPSVRSAVDQILRSIERIDEDEGNSVFDIQHVPSSADAKSKRRGPFDKMQGAVTRKRRLGWTLRGKSRFIERLGLFDDLVAKLFDLVPLDQSTVYKATPIVETSLQADFHNALADMQRQLDNDIRKGIDDWLNAYDTRSMYEVSHRKRLDGTCDWILDRHEFLEWESSASDDPMILWIRGPAGYGKTILCSRIVEHLMSDAHPAYFFFSSELRSREDPFAVMKSWISQVMMHNQYAFDLVRGKWEVTEGRTASRSDIEELFTTIVQEIPKCMFVVDGLDECSARDNDRAIHHGDTLLDFLKSTTKIIAKSSSRLLIVSRNEREIREGLVDSETDFHCQLVELQINPEDVKLDVTQFSQNIVKKKLANKSEADRQELVQRIVDRCESMFLGVQLLEPDIRGGKNLKQLRRVIDEAPNKLDRIYDRNWERIENRKESKRRAFSILRWAVFALRPMTVSEITEALLLEDEDATTLDYTELPDAIDEFYIKTEILELCESLIEIRQAELGSNLDCATIHLSHFSVRQYILSHLPVRLGEAIANEQLQSSYEAMQNNVLARACLRYLNHREVWDDTQTQEESNPMIRAFRNYAANSWYKHVNHGNAGSKDIFRLINSFFYPGNENWESWRRHSEATFQDLMIQYEGTLNSGNSLFYASLLGLSETVSYLIEVAGLDVNYVDLSNRTALLAASTKGWLQGVTELLRRGASINVKSNKERGPLYAAAHGGHAEVVKLLLDKGADVSMTNYGGWTPLNVAADCGHIEVVKILVENGADLSIPSNEGWTPLNLAADSGHVEVVKLLLDKGVDLAISNNYGWTPLHSAADSGHTDVVKLLLESGADLSISTNKGWTPLNLAAHNGHTEVVRLLLENGADLSISNVKRWTPLNSAADSGHTEVVELLLENGADSSIPNKYGLTPLTSATYRNHVETVKLLVEKGANMNVNITFKSVFPGRFRASELPPLFRASEEGHTEIFKFLLGKGAGSPTGHNANWTPLLWAANEGLGKSVSMLLEQEQVDPDFREGGGRTALSWAAAKGWVDVIKFLLADERVDRNSRDKAGLTPLQWAARKSRGEAVSLLVKNGCSLEDGKSDQFFSQISMFMEDKEVELIAEALGFATDQVTLGLEDLFAVELAKDD